MTPTPPTESDLARVRELLGREPRGGFTVVVRDDDGDPVVLRNEALLDDGTPMPTRYWLIGPSEVLRVSRLEAAGGVGRAEAAVDPDVIAEAHRRYATERDAAVPTGHTGPRPAGGVGGTRVGVKCLHAHWAWFLAGGDDPVGRWIEEQFATRHVHVDDTATVVRFSIDSRAREHTIPWGIVNLTAEWLVPHDPPRPDALVNALGAIDDHLDDIIRAHAGFAEVSRFEFDGAASRVLAQVEFGGAGAPADLRLDRAAAEEVFRMVATESAADRAHNPGLPSAHVDTIVATCCIVVAIMRRFHLDHVVLA